jgi:hypothetical protein
MGEPIEDPVEHPEIDELEEDEATEDDALEDEVKEFRATSLAHAKDLASVAAKTMAGNFADDLVERQKKPAVDPKILNHNPGRGSQRLTIAESARDTALSGLTDARVRGAIGQFFDLFFPVTPDPTQKPDPAELAARLDLLAHAQPVPGGADPALSKALDAWKAMKDGTFWYMLATRYAAGRVPLTALPDHLVLVGLAGRLSPLTQATHWLSPAQKTLAVDRLLAASGAGVGGVDLTPNGTVDLSRLYRCAMELAIGNRLLPRAAVVELVQLALGELTNGVKDIPTLIELNRNGVAAALADVADEPARDPAETKARNVVRQTARTLLDVADGSKEVIAKGDTELQGILANALRGGRWNLAAATGDVITDFVNALAPLDGGPDQSKSLMALVASSHLDAALEAWSAARRAPGPRTAADLQAGLQAVHDAMSSLVSGFGQSLDRVPQTILPLMSALAVEIGYQTTEQLGDVGIDIGGPLDGPLASLDNADLQSRNRRGAIRARDGKGLGTFVTSTTKRYKGATWARDLGSAADAWSTADDQTADDLATASTTLDGQLTAIEKTLTALSPEQRYYALLAIDAVANAAADRLRGVAQTRDLDTLMLNLPPLANRLAAHVAVTPITGDLAVAWTTALNAVASRPSLPIDLGAAVKSFQTAVAGGDALNIAKVAYGTIEAIKDARRRVESSSLPLADRVRLLATLDGIGAAVATGLRR